jgi:hypothetical protein
MVQGVKKFLTGFSTLLLLVYLTGELILYRYNWPEVAQIYLVPGIGHSQRRMEFRLSDALQAEIGFSEGNHSYYTLNLQQQGRSVLRWWGTPSLASRPGAWIESGLTFPRVLTYQPLIFSDGVDTPLGAYRCGFYLWTFDGRVYREQQVELPWLNLWLRSPFPFQD